MLENGMIGRDFRHASLKSAADVNSFDDPECQNLEGKSAEFRWRWFSNGNTRDAMPCRTNNFSLSHVALFAFLHCFP